MKLSLCLACIIYIAILTSADALIFDHRYALLYFSEGTSATMYIYNTYDTLGACQSEGALLARKLTPHSCDIPGSPGDTGDACTRVTFCLDQSQQIRPSGPRQ